MTEWNDFISRVQEDLSVLRTQGCDMPFFRGHSDNKWKLLCGLGRQKPEDFKKKNIETILYYDYMSLAGPLIENSNSSWDVLFSMQHHGLPTRLLDWTLTFSVALYFSIKEYVFLETLPPMRGITKTPCVWVLNPYELNRSILGNAAILNPHTDLIGNYQENFIERSKDIGADVMAINPTKSSRRLAVQKGVFTLHSNLFKPLEDYNGQFLKRYDLPRKVIPDAIRFLMLAGTNEFSLFPDLDGLARHLKKEHVDWQ
jgi:hypothetical protein